jgi:ABC-type glycerol-3-phosphate transport system permease component
MDVQNIQNSPPMRRRSINWQRRSIIRFLSSGGKWIAILIASFVVIIPILWVYSSAFKTDAQIQAFPPQLFPTPISLRSFIRAFQILPLGRLFLNSFIIATAMIVSNIVFCSLAGYTFARKRFFGRDVLFALVLSSMVVPFHIRLIPTYIIINWLHLTDTYAGIVLPSAVTAFGIFMMRQFFMSIPPEIEDAARVDGCSDWGVVFRIMIPISMPAIISLGLFALVWSFEDFVWPLIVTSSPLMRPIQVGVVMFLGITVYEWGPIMAMTAIMITPLIVIYLFAQRFFIRGMTAGAVKG